MALNAIAGNAWMLCCWSSDNNQIEKKNDGKHNTMKMMLENDAQCA